jgi:hypothetical protein
MPSEEHRPGLCWDSSAKQQRFSSSLYGSAASDEYFAFVSHKPEKAPGCLFRKSWNEPLPPTFIVLNCTHDHWSKLVDLNKGKKNVDEWLDVVDISRCCCSGGEFSPEKVDVDTHVEMNT